MSEETIKKIGFIEAYEYLFGVDEFNVKCGVTEDAEEYSEWQEFDEENERQINEYKQKFISLFKDTNRT